MASAREAESLVTFILNYALAHSALLAAYAARLKTEAGIRLIDTVDHLAVGYGERAQAQAGWIESGPRCWRREGFPFILERPTTGVALRVENLERLRRVLGIEEAIEGPPGAPARKLRLPAGDGLAIEFLELNGGSSEIGAAPAPPGARRLRRALLHRQIFRTRRRHFRAAEGGLSFTERLIDAAVADLGPAWACALFLQAEIEYWQTLCEAGMRQKFRQDRAGGGWCTLDRIVYRASRERFHSTAQLAAKLGYRPGSVLRDDARRVSTLVMAHNAPALPRLLLEVDCCLPEDLRVAEDGATPPLPALTWHAEAGLWSALHGEPLLEGGIARVAARYDVGALGALLDREDDRALEPTLRAIAPARIDTLERGGHFRRAEAERMRCSGATAPDLTAVDGWGTRGDGLGGEARSTGGRQRRRGSPAV